MNAAHNNEANIISRIGESLTPEASRAILAIRFSAQDEEQMRELLDRGSRGTRTPEENREAAVYDRLGHTLSMLKSIARRRLLIAEGILLSRA